VERRFWNNEKRNYRREAKQREGRKRLMALKTRLMVLDSKISVYFIFKNRILSQREKNAKFPTLMTSENFSSKKSKKGLHTSRRLLIFASAIAKHAYALAL